ncbi:hypothetical protein V6Z11_D11G164000, partial [Gossypium hirsutum]
KKTKDHQRRRGGEERGNLKYRTSATLSIANKSLFFNLPWRHGIQDKGRPLPKFGEWDVNDPSSAEGFTVIFNKARNEKKTGGKIESPGANDPACKQEAVAAKPQKKWLCCVQATHAD